MTGKKTIHRWKSSEESARQEGVRKSSRAPAGSRSPVVTALEQSIFEATGSEIGSKAKSCKRCFYYSSRFKANAQNPLRVGLTLSVCLHILLDNLAEASKEGRNLTQFRYACAGYALFEDCKGHAPKGQQPQSELLVCFGLEVKNCEEKFMKSIRSPINSMDDQGKVAG
ncbi:Unknown protein [Striga hermonthica]|uniref:DUF8204 domain-containing protein n=1 Tax=Striga hermonthica TaxID=68872 RepID=A0A9N7RE55_STRHE|nr:Unknown protein [Striga hermonthica]